MCYIFWGNCGLMNIIQWITSRSCYYRSDVTWTILSEGHNAGYHRCCRSGGYMWVGVLADSPSHAKLRWEVATHASTNYMWRQQNLTCPSHLAAHCRHSYQALWVMAWRKLGLLNNTIPKLCNRKVPLMKPCLSQSLTGDFWYKFYNNRLSI